MRMNEHRLWITCVLTCASLVVGAQITAPGHDRDLEAIKQMQANSVLDRDTVVLRDTIVLYDPDTYVETRRIVESRMSIRDYCTEILAYDTPNELLKGQIITITDPVTYAPLKIRWNPQAAKIDTIE